MTTGERKICEELRQECGQAGDEAGVEICDRALAGDEDALGEVHDMIKSAQDMRTHEYDSIEIELYQHNDGTIGLIRNDRYRVTDESRTPDRIAFVDIGKPHGSFRDYVDILKDYDHIGRLPQQKKIAAEHILGSGHWAIIAEWRGKTDTVAVYRGVDLNEDMARFIAEDEA